MKKREEIAAEEQKIINRLNAFYYFKAEGMETVKKIYAAEVKFVFDNSHRAYKDVRNELIDSLLKLRGMKSA
ncbi:MAG: hypothetical protein V4615_11720 [Bacteroidota bacterium]